MRWDHYSGNHRKDTKPQKERSIQMAHPLIDERNRVHGILRDLSGEEIFNNGEVVGRCVTCAAKFVYVPPATEDRFCQCGVLPATD